MLEDIVKSQFCSGSSISVIKFAITQPMLSVLHCKMYLHWPLNSILMSHCFLSQLATCGIRMLFVDLCDGKSLHVQRLIQLLLPLQAHVGPKNGQLLHGSTLS